MYFDCADITDESVSALTKVNKCGNKDDECNNFERIAIENNNCERNASENKKSADEKVSKQNKIGSTNKTRVKDNTYPDNPPILTRLGEDPFQQLVTNKLAHINNVGTKVTSLPPITKYLSPKISVISGLHTIRQSAPHLDDTPTDSSVIYSNQATTIIY